MSSSQLQKDRAAATIIQCAIEKHGDRFDYSKTVYLGTNAKSVVRCVKHNLEFETVLRAHIKGNGGCPECSYESRLAVSRRLNDEARANYFQRARAAHNSAYTYDESSYSNIRSDVTAYCLKHGKFTVHAGRHVLGKAGCPYCGDPYLKSARDAFITRARNIHGDRYSYDKVKYGKTNRAKLLITCPTHGDFEQSPFVHLQGKGCPECAKIALKEAGIKAARQSNDAARSSFVKDSNQTHNNKYDYSKVVYKTNRDKVTITCPEHGDFEQNAGSHRAGTGCPKCGEKRSRSEEEVLAYVRSLGVTASHRVKDLIPPYEVDIYLPDHKVGIEYHGLYWHSSKFRENDYHQRKMLAARAAGIRLIQIFSDEWINKRETVKSVLAQKLGLSSNKTYARNCVVETISPVEARSFLEDNHLQGADAHAVAYGLRCKGNNRLLALLTMAKPSKSGGNHDADWNVSRFVIKCGWTVSGAFSKLLKHFIRKHAGKTIVTYADLRWSNGDVYRKNGFSHTHDTKPNYWYVRTDEAKRYHRYGFRKSLLKRRLAMYDESLTERENMDNNGWLRVYDAGNAAFIMHV